MKKRLLLILPTLVGLSFINAQSINKIHDKVLSTPSSNLISKKSKLLPQSLRTSSFWGAGTSTGTADGEFSNSFTQATTYTPGDNTTTWTALSENENSGATIPGSAYWVRSTTGISQGAYFTPLPIISSPSQTNGCAIFDSDFMDNGGVAGAFGSGTTPAGHRGSLISPRIDATGYTDQALTISFYSYYRPYTINELSISFSTDDGATWSSTDFRAFQPSTTNANVEGFVSVNFISETVGINDLTQCRIKFTFDGDYYFSMIDDVSIGLADAHDLTIEIETPNGNMLNDAFYQMQITNNRHFPLSQINTHHLFYGANIKNYGYENVYPNDGATLNLEIQKYNGTNWIAVYNQSTNIDTVLTTNGRSITDTLNSSSWAQDGDFKAVYITSLSSDNNSNNDTSYHFFSINDNNYASKVSIDQNDNKPFSDRSIFPGGTDFQSFEYGSMFEFSNATNDSLKVDSVSFRYYVPYNYTGPVTTTLFVNIYKFTDGNNGGDVNGTLDNNGNELTFIGVQQVNITGIGTVITEGSYGTASAANFIDPGTGNNIDGLTDGYYFVTLLNNPSLTGSGPTFNSNTSIWYGASEEKNYALNINKTTGGSVISVPSPVKITDGTGIGEWNWPGFGTDISPSLGVHLSGGCIPVNYTDIRTECNDYTWIDGNTYNTDTIGSTYTIVGGAANGCDSVITLNLSILPIKTSSVTTTICNNDSVIVNGTVYNAANPTGTEVISNVGPNNCDSTITVNLDVLAPIDISTVLVNQTITANETTAGTNYRWLDCNDNNAIIPNETEISYTATSNGNYAVEVTVGPCVDTSACTSIITTGINTESLDNISLYPNPTTNIITVDFGKNNETLSYTVMSIDGKVIMQVNNVVYNQITIDLTNQSKGVYFLSITSENNSNKTYKIFKK